MAKIFSDEENEYKQLDPILYILMRNDLKSLNPGKAMAQAAHASNAFINDARSVDIDKMKIAVNKWQHQTSQGFGTTIVLSASIEEIETIVETRKKYKKDFIASTIIDPTYPVSDGVETHIVSIPTCGYIFTTHKDKAQLLNLSLYP